MTVTTWKRNRIQGSTVLKWSLVPAGLVAVALFIGALGQIFTTDPGLIRVGTAADVRNRVVVPVAHPDAFVVADGTRFLGFSAHTPHLGELVKFCARSQWFEDPDSGSKFSRAGEYRAGPARRGLDRYRVVVRDGDVFLDPTHRTEGPPRGFDESHQRPAGQFCV